MNNTNETAANRTVFGGTNNLTGIVELFAFHLGSFQRINRGLCFVLGFPANILVMVVIARSRQLWSPRTIFWLAVTFFNFIAVIESTMELGIFHLYQQSDGSHQLLCQIFSTQFGLPYGLLLAGLTLASCERYLALARQQFYQNYATTKNDSMNRNRLEIHAARILGFGILPFCLVHLTLCICGVIGTILKSQGFNTSLLRMVMMMCRELIRLHLIYIPVVFMTQSREFRAAFKRFCRFRKSKKAENFN